MYKLNIGLLTFLTITIEIIFVDYNLTLQIIYRLQIIASVWPWNWKTAQLLVIEKNAAQLAFSRNSDQI